MYKKKINAVSKLVSQLTLKQIEDFSDEAIMILGGAQRPNKEGIFVFVLNHRYFRTKRQYIDTYFAIAKRLARIRNNLNRAEQVIN